MASIKPRELDAAVCEGIAGRRVGGLLWTGAELSWVDAKAGRLRLGRQGPNGFRHIASLGVDGTADAAVPARGGWIVGGHPAHLRRDGRLTPLALPAATGLWCDPAGRLWLNPSGARGLRRLDLTGALTTAFDPTASIPTASDPTASDPTAGATFDLAWSPDTTTMYRACPDGLVAHDFDLVNGIAGPPRTLVAGDVSGVAADDDGFAWAATPEGVLRVDPQGGLHAIARVTGATPVGCCFVGGTLLIATAEGAVHECVPGVRGRPAVSCACALPAR